MKTLIKNAEIIEFAKNRKASEFEAFCNLNDIQVRWEEVNLSDFDEDYYNVTLVEHDLCFLFCDGEFLECQEL